MKHAQQMGHEHDTTLSANTRNIKLVIEYDGTNYKGWQRQARGETIQQKIEEAIEKITQEKSVVHGSGRTDAGVHALGQVANFKTSSRLTIEKFLPAINANLPRDIVVRRVEEVDGNFHARFNVKSKVYRYTILNDEVRTALNRNFCYQFWPKLNVEKMRQAASFLVGKHDFRAFQTEASRCKNSVRNLMQLDIKRNDRYIYITTEADGFLYNMVRAIVGTLIDVGRGKIDVEEFKRIFESKDRRLAGQTAPPRGLCLVKVKYE